MYEGTWEREATVGLQNCRCTLMVPRYRRIYVYSAIGMRDVLRRRCDDGRRASSCKFLNSQSLRGAFR
jgi:hypothetical protein